MAHAHAPYKTVEAPALKTSLTPSILDDDPAQLGLLSAFITDRGYEVMAATDPEEAWLWLS